MDTKTVNNPKTASHKIRERLSQEVYGILAACLHQFDEGKELDEDCFDVDRIMAGRPPEGRQLYERRTKKPKDLVPRSYRPSRVARGTFIPHQHLFNSIVKAHA